MAHDIGEEDLLEVQTEAQQAEVGQPVQSEGPFVSRDNETVGLDSVTMQRELLRYLRHNKCSRKPISIEFLAVGMTMFDGKTGTDPTDTEYWLKKLQRLFLEMDYPSDRKLRAAVSLLQGEALNWWEAEERVTTSYKIDWEFFRQAFEDRYLGPEYLAK